MSLDVTQIEAIRTQTLTHMQNLLANAGPTITVNSVEIAWAPLLASLERTVAWCDQKIAEYDPYEVRSRAET